MENMDWGSLPFGYQKTDYNVRCYYKDGKWGKIEVSDSEYLSLHMAATCLHYGQEAFEGLKAYTGKDGKIRIFRWIENLKRMNSSAYGIMMPEIPTEIFKEAIHKAVSLNKKYVPPYGSGATLYIRPLFIGTSAEVGVKPAHEYMFMIFVTPVGPYFKTGFNPTNVWVGREFDRAAPLGTGTIKVGGNYAASLRAIHKSHELGYTTVLYLDPKEKKYIDEIGQANFFAIKGNKYITPISTSILPSITNKSLMELAKDMGLEVEQRQIEVEELSTFDEAGQCGTAAVISPIGKIVDDLTGKEYTFCKDGQAGPISKKLYERLTNIQFGEEQDKFGWIDIIE